MSAVTEQALPLRQLTVANGTLGGLLIFSSQTKKHTKLNRDTNLIAKQRAQIRILID